MQNKDLVSCCLSYSANAKTAILQYLNCLECEGKVNVKKIILPIQKMLYASLDGYICLGPMFLPRVYLVGNTLATVSAEPLNKFDCSIY